MKFCLLDSTDVYYNLAVEEYLFETSLEEVFLLWQNSKTVVIGKNQNAFAEINAEYLDKNNVKLARRITGGGAVYHDEGNVNYSVIIPKAKTEGIDFLSYASPVIKALKSLGINVTLSGRNDLVLDSGKKISGSAQHRVGDRVLHHGTLLFSSDLNAIESALNVSQDKLLSKAVKSVKSRVQNLSEVISKDMQIEDFLAYLSAFIISELKAEIFFVEPNEKITWLEQRNKSIGWLYPEKDYLSKYQTVKKKRYDFGNVELNLNMKNNEILSLKITGDFFELLPVCHFEKLFDNAPLSSLKFILENHNVGDYILGMKNEEFLALIKS